MYNVYIVENNAKERTAVKFKLSYKTFKINDC